MRFVGSTKLFGVVKTVEGVVAFRGWVVGQQMGSRVAVRVSIVPFFHMWDGFFFYIQTA